jgi:hypothetical protein
MGKIDIAKRGLARQTFHGIVGILEQARIPPYPEVVVESPDGSAEQQDLGSMLVRSRRVYQ